MEKFETPAGADSVAPGPEKAETPCNGHFACEKCGLRERWVTPHVAVPPGHVRGKFWMPGGPSTLKRVVDAAARVVENAKKADRDSALYVLHVTWSPLLELGAALAEHEAALLMAPTETTAGGPGVVEQSLRAQVTALEAKVDRLRTENTNLSNERGTVMTQLEGERRDHHATQTQLDEAKAWIAQVDNVLNVTGLDHVKGDRIDKILAALNYCTERDREVTLLKKERDLAREQRDAADARAEAARVEDAKLLKERDEARAQRDVAEKVLITRGYLRVPGPAGWKPPLGKAPDYIVNEPRVLHVDGLEPKTYTGPVSLDEFEKAIALNDAAAAARGYREGLVVARDLVCPGCGQSAPMTISGTHHRGAAGCGACVTICRAREIVALLGKAQESR